MITLKDVKWWIPSHHKNRGDCICKGSHSHWVSSLCGWMGPGTAVEYPEPPKMICGACKKAMKQASVHHE